MNKIKECIKAILLLLLSFYAVFFLYLLWSHMEQIVVFTEPIHYDACMIGNEVYNEDCYSAPIEETGLKGFLQFGLVTLGAISIASSGYLIGKKSNKASG